jgi:murein DD-endopeptidase MepM/ murein hydrolase activator NlpD
MASKRYTILVTDLSSGTSRAATAATRPVVVLACAALTMPLLAGLGAAWKGRQDVADLYASHQALEAENASYRSATADLSDQIASLQSAVGELTAQSAIDPKLARAMEKLPVLVRARAMGGGSGGELPAGSQASSVEVLSALTDPEETFGLLRTVLEGVESRLVAVGGLVEQRNALAAATPALWPTRGWLTSPMGRRQDPMSAAGGQEFHSGLDIAADTGQPVYATAEGTVKEAAYHPAYGNLIVLDHGFGLESRYGHLSTFEVERDQRVTRGDIIGRVGATGRATGSHLHYEVLANGRLLNPIHLLTQRPRDR